MPKPLLCLVLLLALALATPAPSVAQSANEQVRIDEIAVSGNRRVAVGTVLSYLPVRVGDRVTRSSLNIALERLYETELFADITIDIDGAVLRIDVVENPIINRVNIEGNDVLDDEKLLRLSISSHAASTRAGWRSRLARSCSRSIRRQVAMRPLSTRRLSSLTRIVSIWPLSSRKGR